MAIKKRARRRVMSDINVVPYIDVMLVLLVIFMVTAPMISPGVVALPSVSSAAAPESLEPIEVSLTAEEAISIRDRTKSVDRSISSEELGSYLHKRQQENPGLAVVIAADKAVSYGAVMKLMDTLQQQGIQKVGLLVAPTSP